MCREIQFVIHSYMETKKTFELFKYRQFNKNRMRTQTPGINAATQMASVYFIRRMTGAPYKTIARFLKSAPSIPARNYNDVVFLANESVEVRKVLDELEFMLLGRSENKLAAK